MERIDEMEDYSGSLKGCWNPRAYQRLDSGDRPAGSSQKKFGGRWRQRLRRIRASPKLKILQAISPKRFLARIHRGYVRAMWGFAGKFFLVYGGDEIGRIRDPPGKEHEERLILHLQKLLLERNRRYAAAGIAPSKIDS